jgi:hypothetical protein
MSDRLEVKNKLRANGTETKREKTYSEEIQTDILQETLKTN